MIKTISLPTKEPFSFKECLFFLDRNYDECLYQIEADRAYRLIQFERKSLPFSVTHKDGLLEIELPEDSSSKEIAYIESYVKEWFDLERDITPLYTQFRNDDRLTSLADKYHGLRLIGIPDLFEALCWSIIGQQINLAFAYKLKRRLVEAYGASDTWQDQQLWHFPTPEALVDLDEDHLRGQQFSRGKIKYLRNVALAFTQGGLSRSEIEALPDFKSRQEVLTRIKGIGEWSANYALMKTLHQPEAIPFGDTGLSQALFNHGIIANRKDRSAIETFFSKVQGWEAYTVFYLWRSLSDQG